jgi:hypothetical protein
MTTAQRQAAFDRHLSSVARSRAQRLGVTYAGTIRLMPPPALPGEKQGPTRYFVNTLSSGSGRASLVSLGQRVDRELQAAEAWVRTGDGPVPFSRDSGKKTLVKTGR